MKTQVLKNYPYALGLAAAGLAFSSNGSAADRYWYGNQQNWNQNNWNDTNVAHPSGLNAGLSFTAGDNVFFASVANTVVVNGSFNPNNVTVSKASFPLRFGGAPTVQTRVITVSGTWTDLSTTQYAVQNTHATNAVHTVFELNSANNQTLNGAFVRTGTIGAAATSIGFTKSGNGQLTYAGNTTLVTGTMAGVSVNGGSLIVTGKLNTATGFSVASGATLGGEGDGASTGLVSAITLAGNATTGGILSPGNGTSGDIGNLYGTSLTWNGTTEVYSQLKFDLSNNSAASDFLSLTGAFTKGTGSIFQFDFGGTGDVSIARTYTLVTAAGGFGTFGAGDFSYTGLANGLTGSFSIDGNNLLFATAVPEPSAFAALAGLGALGFVASRRRRRAV